MQRQYLIEVFYVMDCVKRCVMTQFLGSVTYVYPEELRQAKMPHLSVDALGSGLDNFLPY